MSILRNRAGNPRQISEGFEGGYSAKQLAEAAGLSVPRVYQIRDGRR